MTNGPTRGPDRNSLRYNNADGFVGRDTDITLLATEPNWIRPTTATLRYPTSPVPNLTTNRQSQILFGEPTYKVLAGENASGCGGRLNTLEPLWLPKGTGLGYYAPFTCTTTYRYTSLPSLVATVIPTEHASTSTSVCACTDASIVNAGASLLCCYVRVCVGP
jgi:hypothetical protein